MKSIKMLALLVLGLLSQTVISQETEAPINPVETTSELDLLKAKQDLKEAKEAEKRIKVAEKEAKKAEKAKKKAEKQLKQKEKLVSEIDSRKRSIVKDQKKIMNLEGKMIKNELKGKLSPVAKAKMAQKINNLKIGIAKEREKLDKLMRKQ